MDATFEGPGSGRWDALQLLTDASIDPLVNEVCLESKCMRVWGIHTITTFMHNITYVAPFAPSSSSNTRGPSMRPITSNYSALVLNYETGLLGQQSGKEINWLCKSKKYRRKLPAMLCLLSSRNLPKPRRHKLPNPSEDLDMRVLSSRTRNRHSLSRSIERPIETNKKNLQNQ